MKREYKKPIVDSVVIEVETPVMEISGGAAGPATNAGSNPSGNDIF